MLVCGALQKYPYVHGYLVASFPHFNVTGSVCIGQERALSSTSVLDYSSTLASVLCVTMVACIGGGLVFLTARRDCSTCPTSRLADHNADSSVQVRLAGSARRRLVTSTTGDARHHFLFYATMSVSVCLSVCL